MRLLEILFYLLKNNNKATTKELSEYFQVSKKTIQRDIDKLTIMGIPIVTRRGGNGGVELDKNYTIHKGAITIDDYKLLILSLCINEKISKGSCIYPIISKLLMVDCKKIVGSLDKLKSYFIVDLYDGGIYVSNDICNDIDRALYDKKYIEIIVDGKEYVILPVSYILRKEGIFLYCYSGEYILINVSKILELKILDTKTNENVIEYMDNKNNIEIVI